MRISLCAPLLLVAAGCSSSPSTHRSEETHSAAYSKPDKNEVTGQTIDFGGGPSGARFLADLEPYGGKEVSISGTFDSIRGVHGIVVLKSGLRVYIPHFDLFARGDDWFKYLGRDCTATGILHTYTLKDIEGYRGPSLEISSFSGSSD